MGMPRDIPTLGLRAARLEWAVGAVLGASGIQTITTIVVLNGLLKNHLTPAALG